MNLVFWVIGAIIALACLGFLTMVYIWYPPFPKMKKGKHHIVCVGDSITFGAGVVLHRKTDSYPAILQTYCKDSIQVMNAGLSGRTAISTGDAPYIRDKYYQKTFRVDECSYIVMLGTNDSKPYNWDACEFEKDYKLFLSKYIAVAGNKNVVVMKPPRSFPKEEQDEVPFDIQNTQILEEGTIIDKIADELGIRVIDLYQLTQEHREWFSDGVHPNKLGNKEIAKHIYKELFD